jgi:Uma2 family endonuclease
MATVVPAPSPTTNAAPLGSHLVLRNVSWDAYEKLLEALGEAHVRTSYDRGTLELMSPSPEHEIYSQAALMAVRVLAKEFGVAIKSLGGTTFKQELEARGLEPDQCFYTANWPRVRGKKRFNLDVDPPPDLAIEVDVMNGSIDRVAIYESLRVPELWRFADGAIVVRLLGPEGGYQVAVESPTFPGIPLAEVAPFLAKSDELDDEQWSEEFRAWVRRKLGRPA